MSQDPAPDANPVDTQVLIAGAGPTGLVLALWLARCGVRLRIIDSASGPGQTSRALVIHPRNLEFYRQLGFAQEAVARGVPFAAANLWVQRRKVARVPFGDIGKGVSAFPSMLILPQDQHQQLLIEQLRSAGIQVEWQTELIDFEDQGSAVLTQLASRAERSACKALYLAGTDGAHSLVRKHLGVGFPGGTYEDLFYVADIQGAGPVFDGEMHGALDDTDFLAIFPMREKNEVRLVGEMRARPGAADLAWGDVNRRLLQRMNIEIDNVQWFSTYHVHHRVAREFARGRVFLLGDAAHVHSPVGGQGMNTGIGDAINLAWKIARVAKGLAPDKLLQTYAPERIAFAQKLVATTDRAFEFITAKGRLASFVRLRVAPLVLPRLLRLKAMRALMFRTLSQTAIAYPASPLSSARLGTTQAGDRLPWICGEPGESDNYAPLSSLDWQLHIYGSTDRETEEAAMRHGMQVYRFPWSSRMHRAGLERNGAYLVRPDGHVGWAAAEGHAAALSAYLSQWCPSAG